MYKCDGCSKVFSNRLDIIFHKTHCKGEDTKRDDDRPKNETIEVYNENDNNVEYQDLEKCRQDARSSLGYMEAEQIMYTSHCRKRLFENESSELSQTKKKFKINETSGNGSKFGYLNYNEAKATTGKSHCQKRVLETDSSEPVVCKKLKYHETTDNGSTFGYPNYNEAKTTTGKSHCQKRMLETDSGEPVVRKKIKYHETTDETISLLSSNMETLKTQRNKDLKEGRKSAARRKLKNIKLYSDALEQIDKGYSINIECLPKPTPEKCVDDQITSQETTATGNDTTVINNPTMTNNFNELNAVNSKKHTGNGHLGRKCNYCIICKKHIKEFCRHFEKAHIDTPEGERLNELNKIVDKKLRKELKTKITDELRKKGNAEFSNTMNLSSNIENSEELVVPVKRSSIVKANPENTVECSHCNGFYRKRSFSRHLKRCEQFKQNAESYNGNALKEHSLPVVQNIEGASKALIKHVISVMRKTEVKENAIKDPLIMKYASEFHKTRRGDFQTQYISRVIKDLSRVVMRMKEYEGEAIKSLVDVFNPSNFETLVKSILQEGGYDQESGTVKVCGLSNRLRSHIKGAAETALSIASAKEYSTCGAESKSKRKTVKHFLEVFEKKWANEVGRIFDTAVKKSRSENDPKLALEDDIVKTCDFICSQYRKVMKELNVSAPGSTAKHAAYNFLLDLLVTHIMCLIRRRPVDFKRAKNLHYEKMDLQEDLISEIKNSQHMKISEEDLNTCNKFKIFYVPGKGWKEMVPIALTKIMKEAMDSIQNNKQHVGIKSDTLFIRAKEAPINPRECIRKVTGKVILKKPMHLSGNGLRHHAGTFSKLHSSHPQYQDYLASALGHTLHIHKLHYEMPTSILQKLIVCPVLHKMTQPASEQNITNETNNQQMLNASKGRLPKHNAGTVTNVELGQTPKVADVADVSPITSDMDQLSSEESGNSSEFSTSTKCYSSPKNIKKRKIVKHLRWTATEKKIIYKAFCKQILQRVNPPRAEVVNLFNQNREEFKHRSLDSLITYIHNLSNRKQKNVTPDVKRYHKHRRLTNISIL